MSKMPKQGQNASINSSDGEIIKAPVSLKNKVRELRNGDDPVARAEAAMSRLSVQFEGWMLDEVEKLKQAFADVKKRGLDNEEAYDALFRAAHDIRGQGQTLGFPLAGRVADSLCRLFLELPAGTPVPFMLVEQHVNAIKAIVREDARGEDDVIGKELVAELERVTSQLVGTERTTTEF